MVIDVDVGFTMYLGEVIGPGARYTLTNYNATSSDRLQVHVLVWNASMATARGPGPLPALLPRSLIPAQLQGRTAETPVSMDFPLQLGFPDAQSRSRRERSPPRGTAVPVCADAWLSSHLCSCS